MQERRLVPATLLLRTTDWERGDFSRGDWAVSEIEYARVGWGPEDGTSIGPDGMASVFRSWLSAWRDWKLVAENYLEVDGERVLVPYSFAGRGKASGMPSGHAPASDELEQSG